MADGCRNSAGSRVVVASRRHDGVRELENRWHIRLLGDVVAARGDHVVRSFGTQKTGLLLAHLACSPDKRFAREELADLLWPESDGDAARTNLRVALYTLRQRLGSSKDAHVDLILSDKSNIRLNGDAVTVDVVEFERACAAASAGTGQIEDVSRAVGLYGGEFLPGFYDSWALETRSRLSELFYNVLRDGIRLAVQAGNLADAMGYAQRALALDTLREDAHLDIIRLYVQSGRHSAAVRQFRALEAALESEMGEGPSVETRHAITALLQNRSASSVAAGSARPRSGDSDPFSPCQPRLPLQISPFFGREEELAWLTSTFADHEARLVTISGPPGSGKTRTATEFGRREVQPRGGAVWFVSLAEITDPGLLFVRLLEAASQPGAASSTASGVRTDDDQSLLDRIAEIVGPREALVILDNAEHLLPDLSPRVASLLSRIPTVSCLVTSRQHLAVRGERELPLLPLPVPSATATQKDLVESASVSLFVDRAQAVRPDFGLTAANGAAVRAICSGADGLPLAIELAAAWVRSLAPQQILERMSDRFDLLVARDLDVPPRHQTLANAIAWSVDNLPPDLQRAFYSLSIFRGGWTLEAAQSLLDRLSDGPGDALPILDELRSRSLVAVDVVGEHARYRLYESLREYGAEKVRAGQLGLDPERLASAHLDYYVEMAERSETAMEGSGQLEWLARHSEEVDNIDAALGWAVEHVPVRGLRMACGLARFWTIRNRTREGLEWLNRLVGKLKFGESSEPPEEMARLLANIHIHRGRFYELHGDYETALHLHETSLGVSRQAGDRAAAAMALNHVATTFTRMGRFEEAEGKGQEALSIMREVGDEGKLAQVLTSYGANFIGLYETKKAIRYLEEAREIAARTGDIARECLALQNLVEAGRQDDRPNEARDCAIEGLRLAVALGDMKRISDYLFLLGAANLDLKNFATSARLWAASDRLLAASGETLAPRVRDLKKKKLDVELLPGIGQSAYDACIHGIEQMDIATVVEMALSEGQQIPE